MKTNRLILSLTILAFWGCGPQEGFTEGPFLRVYNATDGDLEVVFDNDEGIRDSLFCELLAVTAIPIDMYARRVNIEFRSASRESRISFDYTMVIRRRQKDITLNLENVVGILDAAQNGHQLIAEESDLYSTLASGRPDSWDLATNSDWRFINDEQYVLRVQ